MYYPKTDTTDSIKMIVCINTHVYILELNIPSTFISLNTGIIVVSKYLHKLITVTGAFL